MYKDCCALVNIVGTAITNKVCDGSSKSLVQDTAKDAFKTALNAETLARVPSEIECEAKTQANVTHLVTLKCKYPDCVP